MSKRPRVPDDIDDSSSSASSSSKKRFVSVATVDKWILDYEKTKHWLTSKKLIEITVHNLHALFVNDSKRK